jgi:enoyl-CoA hydratase/carnithine racemase
MNDLRLDYDPPLAWVTFNRPERRNAVTSAMWQELRLLVDELEGRTDVLVVLMRGAGAEAFSAGADITEMRTQLAAPESLRVTQQAVQDGENAWAQLDRPTIALISGACTGAGCGLALACDLRLATPSSFFAVPPARLGLVYSLVDTRRIVDLAGPARAKEILFTGRRISAEEAVQWGLVNRLVPQDSLETEGRALASQIASLVPHSVRAAKRIINAIAAGARAETEESRRLYAESFNSEAFRTAAAAFVAKSKGG